MNDGEKPSLIGDVLFKGRKPGGIGGRREERSETTGGSWEEKSETTGGSWEEKSETSEGVGKKKARPLGEKGV